MNPLKTLLLYTSLTVAAITGLENVVSAQVPISSTKQQEIREAYFNQANWRTIEQHLGQEKDLYHGSMAKLLTAPENGFGSIKDMTSYSTIAEPWIDLFQVGHGKGIWNAENQSDLIMTLAIFYNKLIEMGKPLEEVKREIPEVVRVNYGISPNELKIIEDGKNIIDICYTGKTKRSDVAPVHLKINGVDKVENHLLWLPNNKTPGGTIKSFPLDDVIWIAYGFNVHDNNKSSSPGESQVTGQGQSDWRANVTKGPLTSFPKKNQPDDQYPAQDSQLNQKTNVDHSGGGVLLGITNRSLLQIGGFIESKSGVGLQAYYVAPFGSSIVEYEGSHQDRQEMMLGKTGVSEITRKGVAKVSMRTFGADITKTVGNIDFGKFPMTAYLITGYRASMLKTDYDYNGDGTEKLRTYILDSDGSKQDVDNHIFNLKNTETQKIYEDWLHSVNLGVGFENGPISIAFSYAIPLNSKGFKDDGFVPGQKDFASNNVIHNPVQQYGGPDSKPSKQGPGNFTISTKINLGWKNQAKTNAKYNSASTRQAQGYYESRR